MHFSIEYKLGMVSFYGGMHYRARIYIEEHQRFFEYDGLKTHMWQPVELCAPMNGCLPSLAYYNIVEPRNEAPMVDRVTEAFPEEEN